MGLHDALCTWLLQQQSEDVGGGAAVLGAGAGRKLHPCRVQRPALLFRLLEKANNTDVGNCTAPGNIFTLAVLRNQLCTRYCAACCVLLWPSSKVLGRSGGDVGLNPHGKETM